MICVTSLQGDMWLWSTAFRTVLTASPSNPEMSYSCRRKIAKAAGEWHCSGAFKACCKSQHAHPRSLLHEANCKVSAITSLPVLVDFSSSLRLVRNVSRRQEGFMATANLQLIIGNCGLGHSFKLRGETRWQLSLVEYPGVRFSFFYAQNNGLIFPSRWGQPEDEEAQLSVRKKRKGD